MTSHKKERRRAVKRFRVFVPALGGKNYCTLSKRFHELGVCIPATKEAFAPEVAVFRTAIGAQNAITRTVEAQRLIQTALTPDFAGFDPLRNWDAEKLQLEEYREELQ